MSSASFSDGVMYSRVLRGLPLRLRWIRARSCSRVHREVGALGHVLAQEPVGVLVRTSLPGRMGVAEVDRDARGHREGTVARRLGALVPGNGAGQLFGQGGDGFAHGRLDGWGSLALAKVQQRARSAWSARPRCRPPSGGSWHQRSGHPPSARARPGRRLRRGAPKSSPCRRWRLSPARVALAFCARCAPIAGNGPAHDEVHRGLGRRAPGRWSRGSPASSDRRGSCGASAGRSRLETRTPRATSSPTRRGAGARAWRAWDDEPEHTPPCEPTTPDTRAGPHWPPPHDSHTTGTWRCDGRCSSGSPLGQAYRDLLAVRNGEPSGSWTPPMRSSFCWEGRTQRGRVNEHPAARAIASNPSPACPAAARFLAALG